MSTNSRTFLMSDHTTDASDAFSSLSASLSPAIANHLFSQSYDLSLQASLPNTAKLHTAVRVCVCV